MSQPSRARSPPHPYVIAAPLLVGQALGRVGDHLHERDRNWAWSEKKSEAIKQLDKTRVAAGSLENALHHELDWSSSAVGEFKSEWTELVESMNGLWTEYLAHQRELDAITKAFREDCPGCG